MLHPDVIGIMLSEDMGQMVEIFEEHDDMSATFYKSASGKTKPHR